MKRRIIVLLCGMFLFSVTATAADDSYQLYFFRHAEKMKLPRGNPDLTEQGHIRANALANYFKDKNLNVIYSTDYQRTLSTAGPVSESQNKNIQLYDPRKLEDLATKLLENKQNALVVGHSNTTPQLVSLVGGKALMLTESDYGDLTILQINNAHIQTKHIKIAPNKDQK